MNRDFWTLLNNKAVWKSVVVHIFLLHKNRPCVSSCAGVDLFKLPLSTLTGLVLLFPRTPHLEEGMFFWWKSASVSLISALKEPFTVVCCFFQPLSAKIRRHKYEIPRHTRLIVCFCGRPSATSIELPSLSEEAPECLDGIFFVLHKSTAPFKCARTLWKCGSSPSCLLKRNSWRGWPFGCLRYT